MTYDFIAIPEVDVPRAIDPLFQHVVTYVSETKKTASVRGAIPKKVSPFRDGVAYLVAGFGKSEAGTISP
jgi:hypothetical protein